MYEPYRQETETNIQFRLNWDKNTLKGLIVSLAFNIFIYLMMSTVDVGQPTLSDWRDSTRTIPLDIIMFGSGDGTGARKGNLTAEGEAARGSSPQNSLEDAQTSGSTHFDKNASDQDPENASNLIARTNLGSASKNNADRGGSGSRNVGKPNGNPFGTGLGDKGRGTGLGDGWGDVDWGGGGNRTVLKKVIPKYPAGVSTNAQIRMKIIVAADGTVTRAMPVQKGDPLLERAAREALVQWRFSKLNTNKDMVGFITLTFQVR